MGKRRSKFFSKIIDGESLVERHENQKEIRADHKQIESTIEIALHWREIDKYQPKYVVGDTGRLTAVTDHQAKRDSRPNPQEEHYHRKFDIHKGNGVENQMIEINKEKNFLQGNQTKQKPK